MPSFRIELEPGHGDHDGVGGRPYLRDAAWPVCQNNMVVTRTGNAPCTRFGHPMTHFLRFDVRPEWSLPFPAGSHFSLFLCVACAGAFVGPEGKRPWRMPERYWEGGPRMQGDRNYSDYGWWYASIEPPGAPLVRAETPEPFVAPARLRFAVGADSDLDFKIGGKSGLEKVVSYTCACGEKMSYFLLVPPNMVFPTLPGAPEQRGGFSKSGYGVFLGNLASFFGCPKTCHPQAVLPFNVNC